MTEVVLYHGSPHPEIKRLRPGSYVSMFPHIANIFGMHYTKKHPKFADPGSKTELTKKYPYGRPWMDSDLFGCYSFTPKIKFKRGYRPDGMSPHIYLVKTTFENINFQRNYPYEMTIKKAVKVTKVKPVRRKKLMDHSLKLGRAYRQHYEVLQGWDL